MNIDKISLLNIVGKIISFIVVVFSAIYFKWETKDLLWSLWISSLTIGSLILISGFAGSFLRDEPFLSAISKKKEIPLKNTNIGSALSIFFLIPTFFILGFSKPTLIFFLFAILSVSVAVIKTKNRELISPLFSRFLNFLINFPAAIFMMGFFAVHFGGFHFVHSIFLNGFFPLLTEQPFGKSIEGTFIMFFKFIEISFKSYFIFILFSLISSFDKIKDSFKGKNANFMGEPYKNVVKMHIMIFVIAFIGFADLNRYILYAALVLYFFPFEIFGKGEKNIDN